MNQKSVFGSNLVVSRFILNLVLYILLRIGRHIFLDF
jgi:hypothetical protein